jgi:NAD-dependent dihydropyrimidine dehydrogenase PreA subunit
MCKYCTEYGDGHKWYLNPANYHDELFGAEIHEGTVKMLGGAGKNTFEVGAMAQTDIIASDLFNTGYLNMAVENMTAHGGQIVPLEDALKILDLCQEPFLLMHCGCRRYFGRSDVKRCLFFWPVTKTAIKERPWEKDTEILTKEEAKNFERDCDKKGFLHSIWHAGVNSDGIPPIVMCHCTATDCVPTKFRIDYGIMNSQRKGEYVSIVDPLRCKDGCKSYPACQHRCQFGAMKYSPVDRIMYVDPQLCFGCGLCRTACPTGAIRLADRTTFPSLVDNW